MASNGTALTTEVARYTDANDNDTPIMDLRQWNDTHFVYCRTRKCNICPFARSTLQTEELLCEHILPTYNGGSNAGADIRTEWVSAVNVNNKLELYQSYVEYRANISHWWSYLVSEMIQRNSGKRSVTLEHLWTKNNRVKGTSKNGAAWNLQTGERFKNLLTFEFNGSAYAVAAYYKRKRDESAREGGILARLSRYEYDTSSNRLLRTDAVLECDKEAGSESSGEPVVATFIGDSLNIVFLEDTKQAIRVYAMSDLNAALDKLPSCIYYSERIPARMESSLPPSLLSLNPSYCGTHLTILEDAKICGRRYTLPSSDAIGRIRSMAGSRLYGDVSTFVMTEKSLCRAYATSPDKMTVNCLVNFKDE
ncbi:hypothetical protein AAVH_27258 [Aphelenchoides avenae]|nr:hypothetical protein AAVH_27258 [Aphelenchus avenae]